MSVKSFSYVYSPSMVEGKPPTEEEYMNLYAQFIAVLIKSGPITVSDKDIEEFDRDTPIFIQKECDGTDVVTYTVNSDLDKTLN